MVGRAFAPGRGRALTAVAGVVVAALAVVATSMPGPAQAGFVPASFVAGTATGPASATTGAVAPPLLGPPESAPLPTIVDADGDWAAGADGPVTKTTDWRGPPARPEVYLTKVSVVPGESFGLRVSSPAHAYSVSVYREAMDAAGDRAELVEYRVDGRPRRDQRGRVTVDAAGTARANWVVTDTVRTTDWPPGVYSVLITASDGYHARALIVVRTPRISESAPLFVVPILTYQAYNYWGGASVYTTHTGVRTWRVSFDRPYIGGVGVFQNTGENLIIGWLSAQLPDLQFTTDYDLSMTPPDVFPDYVVLGRHTEYVPAAMLDWLVDGVETRGVMGLANLGANSLYWQARLERPAAGAQDAPFEIVCYKNDSDPTYPHDPVVGRGATARWRDPLVGRPEGSFMGAQFTAVLLGDGHWPAAVTADAPAWLLRDTGLVAGVSLVADYMTGEADAIVPAGPPGSRTTAVLVSTPSVSTSTRVGAAATIRTFASGGRVFNASTLGVPEALSSDGTVRTMMRNVLDWVAGSRPGGN